MHPFSAVLLACLASLCSKSAEFQLGEHRFSLPEGFSIERVAGPELIDRPIEADLDEQGRLYVTESSGSNEPVAKQLEEKPHRVLRLSDENGDGVYDRITVFADQMMFPEGALWYHGSLYVSAPPVIWKLTDTDNDGVAEKHEEWLDAKTLTGCANDLHGPYLGLDGWIYWCKGAFAEQSWEQPGGKWFKSRAAHIFRRRPEGGFVEAVMTGGMDNPVGLTFTREGERIFSATFLQQPSGGKRDGLVHAVYGGVYGKVNEVVNSHPQTGELMPVLTHLGPAAPAGLTRYQSEVFGPDYKDNLFTALFNLHKVTRHVLKPKGASFTSEDSDFLVSNNPDFHPTDVLEDADGSLLIIDTGGWYKLCCPTSQLWKPDVLGGIYRVRRVGAPSHQDPRGGNIRWAELSPQALSGYLGDPRPAVVNRATTELAKVGNRAIPGLKTLLGNGGAVEAKQNAIWALTRIGTAEARELVRQGLRDESARIQQAAIHSIGVWRDQEAVEELVPMLTSPDLAVRRAAAESLGRLKQPRAVAAILSAINDFHRSDDDGDADRILEHSYIYALIELNQPQETRKALAWENRFCRRAALIALDQMEARALKPSDVVGFLGSEDSVLRSTAHWIVQKHPEWGKDLIGFYRTRMASLQFSEAEAGELSAQLGFLSGDPAIQELLATTLASSGSPGSKSIALRAILASGVKEVPAKWTAALVQVLRGSRRELSALALKAAAKLYPKEAPPELIQALEQFAGDETLGELMRLQAISAINDVGRSAPQLIPFLRKQLSQETPSMRILAATALARSSLTEEQLLDLTEEVRRAGALEIGELLGAFDRAGTEVVGRKLLQSLADAPGFPALQADRLRAVLSKYPEAVQNAAGPLLQQLHAEAEYQLAQIERLLPKLKDGDVRRGQAIFNSERTACASCHAIGYLGGTIGPDLTRIGQIRTERDLLESILFPSASFVRSYEPVIVATADGEEYSGVLRKDGPEEVVIAVGLGSEVTIPRKKIAELRPGKVSIMPQGLAEQLSEQELGDLLAFLKATRW